MPNSLLIGGTYDGDWMSVEDSITELRLHPKIIEENDEYDSEERLQDYERPICMDIYREFKADSECIMPRLFYHVSISKNLVIYNLMRGYLNAPQEIDGSMWVTVR